MYYLDNKKGFMLLYTMVFILCISGFSMYLVHHYEMERKLLAHELEDMYTQQLVLTASDYLIDAAGVSNSLEEELIFTGSFEKGKVTGTADNQGQHWQVEIEAESGVYRRKVQFIYEHGAGIFHWEEES
ncbi:MAG: hypothetical protein EA344_10695 [Alkalicoccus sp.]|nr:MAG: hypothetical protein EA344_10695 [Alkalicoccus sp.]